MYPRSANRATLVSRPQSIGGMKLATAIQSYQDADSYSVSGQGAMRGVVMDRSAEVSEEVHSIQEGGFVRFDHSPAKSFGRVQYSNNCASPRERGANAVAMILFAPAIAGTAQPASKISWVEFLTTTFPQDFPNPGVEGLR
jgi:hypothetical protein